MVSAPQQRINQRPVAAWLLWRELVARNGVKHAFKCGDAFVIAHRLVAALPQRLHLGRAQAKDEDVVIAHVLANLDVGAVVGADGQCAIERQLHVAGARGFGAGGRYLLR